MDIEESLPGVSQRAKLYQASNLITSCKLDDYFVGKGSYGAIRKCKVKDSNKVVAAKCFSINFEGNELDSKVKGFLTEINSLVRIQHENIVQVFGYTKWKTNVAIIMEYVDGVTLKRIIHHKAEELPWTNRIRVVYQLVLALKYLHNYKAGHELRHGDIKPDNIILTRDLVVKLTDFGAANIIRATGLSTSTSEVPPSRQYTILYAAPETEALTMLADMYSFAIVVYEIITRVNPFSEYEVHDAVLFALKQNGKKPQRGLDEVKQHLSSKAEEHTFDILYHIMQSCWDVDSNKRSPAKEVVDYMGKHCMGIVDLTTRQDPDKESKPLMECEPSEPGPMVELSCFTAPFEECSVLALKPGGSVPGHSFGFTANLPRPNRFSSGKEILYSLDGSFENGFLWHTTINPTSSSYVKGVTEKIDLQGNRVASEWFEANRAIIGTFTNITNIQQTPLPVISLSLCSNSVIFTLRNGNSISEDYKELLYEVGNLTIETGVIKRGSYFQFISGLAIDKSATLSLSQFALALADQFGAFNVRYVSYSSNDEVWRVYMYKNE